MLDYVDYSEFLDMLPEGRLEGRGSDEFGVAASPSLFVEPKLELRFEADVPSVTLVSARGATGKSTLAKALSCHLHAPLWSLDKDRTVSGDALDARLSKYLQIVEPRKALEESQASVVIDALDEARLRVSGESWSEFVESLIAASRVGVHLVLLGRTRVLEDLWVQLEDAERSLQWFEISHFDSEQQREYIDARRSSSIDADNPTYVEARDAVLKALLYGGGADVDEAFVGYAPVLDAVTALLGEGANLQQVKNKFSETTPGTKRVEVLQKVLVTLLKREQGKVLLLADQLGLPRDQAFSVREQLQWLASGLLEAAKPPLQWCPTHLRDDYVAQITPFVEDHPFRSNGGWASPVFSAFVAYKLFDDTSIEGRLPSVGGVSSLLFEFMAARNEDMIITEQQFTALYSSLLAGQWRDAEATVTLENSERRTGVDSAPDSAHGELILRYSQHERTGLSFELALETSSVLRLRSPLASLEVRFDGEVVIEPRAHSVDLGPDLFIRAKKVAIEGDSVQISRGAQGAEYHAFYAVELEILEEFSCNAVLATNVPSHALAISIAPEVEVVYPWHGYANRLDLDEPLIDMRAIRFLNRFMDLVRSHGHKGPKAVFDKKLEGRQSIKGGEFREVVEAMHDLGVVTIDGSLIKLNGDYSGPVLG